MVNSIIFVYSVKKTFKSTDEKLEYVYMAKYQQVLIMLNHVYF